MLKICGVTFDHTTNYGSCLQAYALQTVIEEMIVQDEPCRYELLPTAIIRQNDPKQPVSKELPWIWAKKRILREFSHWRRKKFEQFETQNIHYADCSDSQQLPALNREYDAFVCGSDVIWNLSFTHADPIYFLAFAEKYKFSYAASFGVCDIDHDFEKWNSEKTPREVYKQYLPDLDQISVREKNSLDLIYELTGKEAKYVCDPVMLLTAEQWNSIIEKDNKRKDYIFAYSTYTSPNYLNFLKRIHRQTGLPIINVTWDIKTAIQRMAFIVPDPPKWLELLKNAKYVVTNSFHATVFSCIFHKSFFCPMRNEQIIGTRIRLYDILSTLGIDGRIYGNTPEKIDLAPPDFTEADKRIQQFRENSLLYIHGNLEKALKQKETNECE